MVQLQILSGKQAGATFVARHFPVRIGRAAASDLRSEEAGVWERHLEILFHPGDGFKLRAASDALVQVNSQPAQEVLLRNGDVVEAGSLKLQFWLGETRQPSLHWREGLTWVGIGAITLGQIGLIYWLLN